MEQNTLWQTIWESTRQQGGAKGETRQERMDAPAQSEMRSEGRPQDQDRMGGQTQMNPGARGTGKQEQVTMAETTVMEISQMQMGGKPAEAAGSGGSCAVDQDRERGISPDETTCGGNNGELPACAPLANPYVPFQQAGSPRYDRATALIRGTIFPGLDLPLVGRVNTQEKDTPLGQLMALNFMVHELGLYLDTHPFDEDAFSLFRKYAGLYREARDAYERCYGPLTMLATGEEDSYNWVQDPWPWDFAQEG